MKKKIVMKGDSLCKTFENGQIANHVIRNLSVDIYEKDFTVIMGSSGAGKSTLLYVLSGMDSITSGQVILNETRIDHLKEKDMAKLRKSVIGFIFQDPNLLDDFNVFENVAVTGYMASKNRKDVHERAEGLLKQVDMLDHLHKYPAQLSGGQKQRVAIARSLINSPDVIFADEPTGALNASQSANVLDLLTQINQNGQSIVMVTHDIKAACRGNRILFINNGKIDGDLNLNQFMVETLEEREVQVFEFLKNKGW